MSVSSRNKEGLFARNVGHTTFNTVAMLTQGLANIVSSNVTIAVAGLVHASQSLIRTSVSNSSSTLYKEFK